MSNSNDDHFTIQANRFLCEYVVEHVNRFLESYDKTLKLRAIARQNIAERLLRREHGATSHQWDSHSEIEIPEPQQWLPAEIYRLLPQTSVTLQDISSQLRDVISQSEGLVASKGDDIVGAQRRLELDSRRDAILEMYLAPFRLLRLQAWTRLARLESGVDQPVDLYGPVSEATPQPSSVDGGTSEHAQVQQLATRRVVPQWERGPLDLTVNQSTREVARELDGFSKICVKLTEAQWFFFVIIFRAGINGATNEVVKNAYNTTSNNPEYDARRDARDKANRELKKLGVKIEKKRLVELDN